MEAWSSIIQRQDKYEYEPGDPRAISRQGFV